MWFLFDQSKTASMSDWQECLSSGSLIGKSSLVLSANINTLATLTDSGKSLMKIRNNRGPSILP